MVIFFSVKLHAVRSPEPRVPLSICEDSGHYTGSLSNRHAMKQVTCSILFLCFTLLASADDIYVSTDITGANTKIYNGNSRVWNFAISDVAGRGSFTTRTVH